MRRSNALVALVVLGLALVFPACSGGSQSDYIFYQEPDPPPNPQEVKWDDGLANITSVKPEDSVLGDITLSLYPPKNQPMQFNDGHQPIYLQVAPDNAPLKALCKLTIQVPYVDGSIPSVWTLTSGNQDPVLMNWIGVDIDLGTNKTTLTVPVERGGTFVFKAKAFYQVRVRATMEVDDGKTIPLDVSLGKADSIPAVKRDGGPAAPPTGYVFQIAGGEVSLDPSLSSAWQTGPYASRSPVALSPLDVSSHTSSNFSARLNILNDPTRPSFWTALAAVRPVVGPSAVTELHIKIPAKVAMSFYTDVPQQAPSTNGLPSIIRKYSYTLMPGYKVDGGLPWATITLDAKGPPGQSFTLSSDTEKYYTPGGPQTLTFGPDGAAHFSWQVYQGGGYRFSLQTGVGGKTYQQFSDIVDLPDNPKY